MQVVVEISKMVGVDITVDVRGNAITVWVKDTESQLAGVTKVLFEEGRKPSATFNGGVLRIVIVPAEGVAGRPSSQRIEHALRK